MFTVTRPLIKPNKTMKHDSIKRPTFTIGPFNNSGENQAGYQEVLRTKKVNCHASNPWFGPLPSFAQTTLSPTTHPSIQSRTGYLHTLERSTWPQFSQYQTKERHGIPGSCAETIALPLLSGGQRRVTCLKSGYLHNSSSMASLI